MSDTVFDVRNLAVLGIVRTVSDGGQAQTATVETHDGVVRGDVEVMQPFGFASAPPGDGGLALLLAVGGDAGHFVALPIACPASRFGGLAQGEAVIYGMDGSRVAIRAGGTIEILAAAHVRLSAQDVAVTAPNGLAITGPVTVTGALSVTESLTVGGALSVAGNASIGGSLTVAGGIHGTLMP